MSPVEMISPQKIGLFGGSFDPIHHGHLIMARDAMESLGLDHVVFIPASVSPHKVARPPAPSCIRCEMVEAAISGESRFSMDSCEAEREGPSFAVDTVRLMRRRFAHAEIFYFIGEDNLPALHSWREIDELQRLARFVVLARGALDLDVGFPTVSRHIDISSTDIRNRIARGLSVRYLLPEAVCAILSRHKLYLND
ncbi:MAG: nicotinate-nucleotide adenylyltransferase [bacterium]